MRARRVILLAIVVAGPAAAADYGRSYEGRSYEGRSYEQLPPRPRVAVAASAYLAPLPGPYVVAPPATSLVVLPPGPPPGLAYAPPPVYPAPPPLIAAVPIIGPYLVPPPYGPPPATVLDAYDHRFDYNQ